MSKEFVIALAQVNPTVGALRSNLELIRTTRGKAADAGADLVVFPELVITGYPPEDLVLKPALQKAALDIVKDLARDTSDGGPALLVGTPWSVEQKLFNGAALLVDGEVKAWRAKHELPNYGVFDEVRVFDAGPISGPVSFVTRSGDSIRLGVLICEDMWFEDVAEGVSESGAEFLIVMNGSPFEHAKGDARIELAVSRVAETGLPLVYVNQVGGQDELVFDGASFALSSDCRMIAHAASFVEDLLVTRWVRDLGYRFVPAGKGAIHKPVDQLEQVYGAMELGLRDYVDKNGFPGVILGLSGGVDSALSAAVAVDALGPERVRGIMMPSRFTSAASLEDATACAHALGIRLDEISIEPAVEAFGKILAPLFGDREPDVTEENIQSRIRGVLLMAVSNKFGPMVLTTGNKSEMSVGYATLYGDMCGGYSVLKDVYKTMVFDLCRWRNQQKTASGLGPDGIVIPERIIAKPPSAELRADQKDEDSLPPYPLLDRILEGLVEDDKSPRDLVENGLPSEEVRRISNLLDLAEYKRRQSPPGVKITRKSFGRDRRYPITNAFRRIGLENDKG